MKISKTRLQQIIKEEIAAATEQDPEAASGSDPEAMVDDLMKSQLFSNAAEEDKAEARKIILDTLMGLEAYGGTKRPDEEYMDDAFRPYEDLTRRLAQAWRDNVPPPPLHYWLDALVAWSLGRKDYEKELYHSDADLERMMRRGR